MGFVLRAPAIFYALHSAGKLHFLVFFGLGAFFLSWYHGPVTAMFLWVIYFIRRHGLHHPALSRHWRGERASGGPGVAPALESVR